MEGDVADIALSSIAQLMVDAAPPIGPEQTEQGFEPLETASNTDSSSTNEQPAAPRRRRTGRRVVRGAGAAGATVERSLACSPASAPSSAAAALVLRRRVRRGVSVASVVSLAVERRRERVVLGVTKPAAGESRRGRRRTPVDYDADFDDVEDINESTSRRRSNRRMNAQERRAAAEVEQIEEDLVLDDITYAPIDEAIARNAKRKRNHENDEEAEAIVEADLNTGSEEGGDGEPTVRRRRRLGHLGRLVALATARAAATARGVLVVLVGRLVGFA